jgi:hypothetical protein
MPTFVLTYRSPSGYSPSPESTAAWQAWFAGMGDRLVELGKPVIAQASVGNCASDSTELGGYSLVDAADLDAAVEMAGGCPHLARNGGVEVGLLGEVPGRP